MKRVRKAEATPSEPMRPLADMDTIRILAQLPPQSFVRNYVLSASVVTDSPLCYHLGAALSLLSATMPTLAGANYAGTLRGNSFIMAVGRSGEDRKSTAVNIAVDILSEAKPELLGPTPGSTEGLTDSLAKKSTQLVVYSELGEFLSKTSQQGGYAEALKTAYTNLYDCQPASRITRKLNIAIQNPRLSILAACARPYLEHHTGPEDWTGGFLRRWLLFYGRRERLIEHPDKNFPNRAAFVKWLTARADLPTVGWCEGLDPEAAALWSPWFRDINERSLPVSIVGIRASVPAFAMKIALLLGWDFGPMAAGNAWRIPPKIAMLAIQIAELHVQSVIALSEHLTSSKDQRDRALVLHQLDEGEALTLGELLKRSRLLKRRGVEIIETLQEEGTIVPLLIDAAIRYRKIVR